MEAPDHEAVVRRSFEQQVDLFTGEEGVFARRATSALAWLEPLDQDMILLDVACGAAHVAQLAAPHVRQVVGVDLTPALLRLGAERLGHAGVGNVLLQEANATSLPFVDASFDLVLCRAAAHHFPHPDRLVAEMVRVCRPGGRVAVSDLVAPNPDVRVAFDQLHRLLDPSHARALLESELAELVRSTVGPLVYRQTPAPFTLSVDQILTDASDRDAFMSALRAELDGGAITGFDPVEHDGDVRVVFTSATIQASRPHD
jgi:ubiquinone/menaquinone biosynthesis C-methylase UbiE